MNEENDQPSPEPRSETTEEVTEEAAQEKPSPEPASEASGIITPSEADEIRQRNLVIFVALLFVAFASAFALKYDAIMSFISGPKEMVDPLASIRLEGDDLKLGEASSLRAPYRIEIEDHEGKLVLQALPYSWAIASQQNARVAEGRIGLLLHALAHSSVNMAEDPEQAGVDWKIYTTIRMSFKDNNDADKTFELKVKEHEVYFPGAKSPVKIVPLMTSTNPDFWRILNFRAAPPTRDIMEIKCGHPSEAWSAKQVMETGDWSLANPVGLGARRGMIANQLWQLRELSFDGVWTEEAPKLYPIFLKYFSGEEDKYYLSMPKLGDQFAAFKIGDEECLYKLRISSARQIMPPLSLVEDKHEAQPAEGSGLERFGYLGKGYEVIVIRHLGSEGKAFGVIPGENAKRAEDDQIPSALDALEFAKLLHGKIGDAGRPYTAFREAIDLGLSAWEGKWLLNELPVHPDELSELKKVLEAQEKIEDGQLVPEVIVGSIGHLIVIRTPND